MGSSTPEHLNNLCCCISLAALIVSDQLHHTVPDVIIAEVTGSLKQCQYDIDIPLHTTQTEWNSFSNNGQSRTRSKHEHLQ